MDTSQRVLVIEDNPNLRKVLVNIVRKIGFAQVSEADDGFPAWDIIQTGEVDLVLADWSMPGLNGLELLKKIRKAKPPICDIPFLMITALDTKEAIVQAAQTGVDAYVIKPFSVATIADKIREAVEKRANS